MARTVVLARKRITQLAYVVSPSTTATDAVAFAQQPTVQLQDSLGVNVPQAGVTVQFFLQSGSATRIGINTVQTDATGLATFTDIGLDLLVAPPGTCTINFTSPGLAPTPTVTVTVVAATTATSLSLTAEPTTGVDAAAFPVQPVVQLRGAGNVAVLQAGVIVTAQILAGNGVLIGTLTAVTNASGVATFSSLGIDEDVSFGAYTELATLFAPANIYQYSGANALVNPMTEPVVTSGVNSYGWLAYYGDWSVVTDAERGAVTRCLFQAGAPGGASPRAAQIGGPLYTVGATRAITSVTASAGVATANTSGAHGFSIGQPINLAAMTGGTQWNGGLAIVATVPSSTQFTYVLASYEAPTGTATGTVAPVTYPSRFGLGFWIKMSANWTDNGNASTKLFFPSSGMDSGRNRITTAASQAENHYLSLTWASDLLSVGLFLQGGGTYTPPGVGAQNFLATQSYARDTWVRVEASLQSSTGNNANGVVQVWCTPLGGATTLVLNSSAVPYFLATQPQGFGNAFISPVYGGGSNPVPADQWFDLDDWFMVRA